MSVSTPRTSARRDSGASAQGQGIETTFAQIAADPLLRRGHWDGRLWFGGSETAAHGAGHMEGALESADRLAHALVEGLNAAGDSACLVPMDGFHLAQAELERLGRAERKGAPDTFDAHGYVALLRRLRTPLPDEVVYAPEFRRELEEPVAGALAVPPAVPCVVTEGNYLLMDTPGWREVRPLLDEVWYVETDDALRVQRLVARHQQFGRSADAARQHRDAQSRRGGIPDREAVGGAKARPQRHAVRWPPARGTPPAR